VAVACRSVAATPTRASPSATVPIATRSIAAVSIAPVSIAPVSIAAVSIASWSGAAWRIGAGTARDRARLGLIARTVSSRGLASRAVSALSLRSRTWPVGLRSRRCRALRCRTWRSGSTVAGLTGPVRATAEWVGVAAERVGVFPVGVRVGSEGTGLGCVGFSPEGTGLGWIRFAPEGTGIRIRLRGLVVFGPFAVLGTWRRFAVPGRPRRLAVLGRVGRRSGRLGQIAAPLARRCLRRLRGRPRPVRGLGHVRLLRHGTALVGPWCVRQRGGRVEAVQGGRAVAALPGLGSGVGDRAALGVPVLRAGMIRAVGCPVPRSGPVRRRQFVLGVAVGTGRHEVVNHALIVPPLARRSDTARA
jgi:hypothetical protein